MFALCSKILGTTKQIVWIYRRDFSVVLKASKVVKWSCIFVRSIKDLPNFIAIPIMNPLTRVHDCSIENPIVVVYWRSGEK